MENEMIEAERKKDIGHNTCVKCGNKLSTTTFRDESGEVVGWVSECNKCDIVYQEE